MAHEPGRWNETKEALWNTVQMVQPGEPFPLFSLSRNGTTIRYDDNGLFGGMASRIRLQTRLFEPLNLSIVATPYALPRAAVITPFDCRLGYPLDQEDFSWRNRYRKITAMRSELATIIHGLGLTVFVSYEELPFHTMKVGAIHCAPTVEESSSLFEPEIALLLKRVFLTLTFPNGSSFTSQAVYHTNRLFLLFRTFFPTDTGPLPVGDPLPEEMKSLYVAEGFRVLLPFDKEQVQTLHAKFLVLPHLDV
jgi:hypothetical protein